MIIQRSPWTSQPQQPVGVDWGNPFGAACDVAWHAAAPIVCDGKLAQTGTVYGTPTFGAGVFGKAMLTDGIADAIEFKGAYTGTGKDYTLAAVFVRRDNSFRRLTGTASSTNSGLHIGYSSASVAFVLTKGAVADINSGFAPTLDTPYFVGVSYVHATGAVQFYFRNLWTGAVDTSTATNSAAWLAGDGNAYVGGTRFFSNLAWLGDVGYAAHINAAVGLGGLASLSVNPWQIFQPLKRNLSFAQVTLATGRPGGDVTTTGWTGVPDNTNKYTNIDEASASDADYITSPPVTGSPAPITMLWADQNGGLNTVPVGTWDVKIRANFSDGATAAQVRVVMLNGGTVVGTGAWNTTTGTYTVYTNSITTTGVSDRFRIEVQ